MLEQLYSRHHNHLLSKGKIIDKLFYEDVVANLYAFLASKDDEWIVKRLMINGETFHFWKLYNMMKDKWKRAMYSLNKERESLDNSTYSLYDQDGEEYDHHCEYDVVLETIEIPARVYIKPVLIKRPKGVKWTRLPVDQIKVYRAEGLSSRAIADKFGTSHVTISKILNWI